MTDPADSDVNHRERTDALYRQIGAQLRAVRLACGVSQEELAQRLKIERVTLSRYETGVRTLPLTTLIAIAELLRRPIADFLPPGMVAELPTSALPSPSVSEQLAPDIARIVAILQQHPQLIPGTQSFLDAMLTPE
jgi:transcriptional regulator with XRE-family HTH domain